MSHKMKHPLFGEYMFEWEPYTRQHRFKQKDGEWWHWGHIPSISTEDEFKQFKLSMGWEIVYEEVLHKE